MWPRRKRRSTLSRATTNRVARAGAGCAHGRRCCVYCIPDADYLRAACCSQRPTFSGVCSFSPDGKYVASGSDDCSVRVWNATTGDRRGVSCGTLFSNTSSRRFPGRRIPHPPVSNVHMAGLSLFAAGVSKPRRLGQQRRVGARLVPHRVGVGRHARARLEH